MRYGGNYRSTRTLAACGAKVSDSMRSPLRSIIRAAVTHECRRMCVVTHYDTRSQYGQEPPALQTLQGAPAQQPARLTRSAVVAPERSCQREVEGADSSLAYPGSRARQLSWNGAVQACKNLRWCEVCGAAAKLWPWPVSTHER